MNHWRSKCIKHLSKAIYLLIPLILLLKLSFAANLKPQTSNLKPEKELFEAYEDTLGLLGDSILHGSTDAVREAANATFKLTLARALKENGSFEYGFDLVKTLGKQTAPDKTFRIYNWLLPKADESDYAYFGFVQTYDKKKKEVALFSLVDSSKTLINPESLKLNCGNWYGALYYKIVKNKKGGKNYYTLLGWHGKDQRTTQKLIDVIYFVSGKPMFGFPFFKVDRTYKDRVIFEYTKQVVMSLKYEEGRDMIIFDHLSPPSKDMQNNFSVYGPDGSYDAFRFKGGHWVYMSDIDARTDWKPKRQPRKPQVHEAPIEEVK
jgi:hypothetical protein